MMLSIKLASQTKLAASGKAFSGGEFNKKCILIAAEAICPAKKHAFNAICLCGTTFSGLARDRNEQIKKSKPIYYVLGC